MTGTSVLAAKRALVTGGAKRIGKEIVAALAEAGAEVAMTYLSSEAEAFATADRLARLDRRVLCLECDVRDEASVQAAVGAAVKQFGGLDLLVNNAGAFETARLEELSVEAWDRMFATNARGPFLMAKAAHGALKASRGRIVNVGSLGGLRAWPTHGHYCASKAALHMLTEAMAKAWAPEISVNTVAPGMIAIGEEDAAADALARKTPMLRNGTAAEVAAAVLFFASSPEFITGQTLAVDGGLGL